jgi:phage terminase large subunit-like protein
MQPVEADELEEYYRVRREWETLQLPLQALEEHQTPPTSIDEGWLIQAGRGSGKTAAMAAYVTDHVRGEPCISGSMPHKMALIAPTLGDAVESADRHPICLRTLNPDGRLQTKPGGTIFTFSNGSEMKLFGTNTRRDVDHLRAGGNNCLCWVEELAAWPELAEAWDQMQLGLRIGPHPHWVGSSTPKNRPKFREIVADPHHQITRAHTDDNPHLEESYRSRLQRLFGGTTKGRQEIAGELLDEVEGAAWKRAWIDQHRLESAPALGLVVVGIDPQGSAEAGTTGIVAAGRTVGNCPCGEHLDNLPHGFVLTDASLAASPDGWARRAVAIFDQTRADRFAAERNYGGDMVESTIRTVWPSAPIHLPTATRGKIVRAEPVSALYEQGRVHHVGAFPELEDEMVTYTVDESWSPNRLDALVWAITELGLQRDAEMRSGVRQVTSARLTGG